MFIIYMTGKFKYFLQKIKSRKRLTKSFTNAMFKNLQLKKLSFHKLLKVNDFLSNKALI